ncbi:MAG: LysE family translocator [Oceanospirillales bacterium]|nr:LysE family translocator [Oceanospirillales bacterium]
MLNTILSMLAFALIGAITPGPVNIIATSSGATYGMVRTFPHVLGATLGYTLVVLTSGFLVAQMGRLLPLFTEGLLYLGSAFLLYMAYRIATMRPLDALGEVTAITAPKLTEGALVQLLNPKAWMVSTSGVALFVSNQADSLQWLLIFGTVSFCMCLLGVGFWAVAGQLFHTLLGKPGRQTVFNRALGGILAATVIVMLTES